MAIETPRSTGSKVDQSVMAIWTPLHSWPLYCRSLGVNRTGTNRTPGKSQLVEGLRRQGPVVDPGGAEALEGGVGPSAGGEVARFQQADTGIEQGLGQAPHVGRGVDPLQAGPVEGVGPPPAFAGDDGQVGVDRSLGVEELGQLADGHPVADGQGMVGDERGEIGVSHRAGDGSGR